jgi:hypothetical protein
MKHVTYLFLLGSLTAAAASTLYKSVDAEGRVTYSDAPPAKGTAEAIDLPAGGVNILPSEGMPEEIERQRQADRQAEQRRAAEQQAWSERYRRAQDELAAAQRALESARQVQEGDVVGSAFGGARPSADWVERLEQAEADVAQKQRALDGIKRSR